MLAGSLVNKDVKGGTRVKGVPAKKILDMKFNKKILKLLVYKGTPTLQNALNIIEQGEERICFLVDKNKENLLNTISDGDIRRALFKRLKRIKR